MKPKQLAASSLAVTLALAMSTPSFAGDSHRTKHVETLLDFNQKDIPTELSLKNTDAKVITSLADGNGAVELTFLSKENLDSSFTFKPQTTWDWSNKGDFAFALDIINPSTEPLHLYTTVADATGQTHNRSVAVPAGSSNTYYMELKGLDLDRDTGLRGNPSSWASDHTPIIWRWGVKNLELKDVTSISFSVKGLVRDQTVIIDNAQLIAPTEIDKNYLVDLVDKFGQSAKVDFDGKVKSELHLQTLAAAEAKTLRKTPISGRSKFGGWLDGPKLKATGYFRTEKVDGKWSLVDPEGYLFFSHGLANVRMSNTSTITGYDFDPSKIKQRTGDDLTPEDSLGLNRVADDAISTRKISSPLRANLFEWLPEYDDALGKHFGYRRTTHTGPVKHGETYSFYQANLERKYGLSDTDKMMERWRETTVDRMLSWGFTSFGNWVDPSYYQMDRIPYFANGWIIGDFKTVSTGNDYWSPLPDPFDPLFTERTQKTVEQIAKEVQNNPWCVGVFIDNEKSWGQMGSAKSQYAIVINTLARKASDSPTKNEFSKLAQKSYSSIDALNAAWGTQLASWQEFDEGVSLSEFTDAALKDFSSMLNHYASEYFRIVSKTVKEKMPNHLYLGARFADWGMTPEIRAAAAKHADVMSYNYYKQGIHPEFFTFLEELDRPSIIGEFHMGASDTGYANPGLVIATNQKDRARMYSDYMGSVIDNPYLVGAHWFQYIDSPISGRAYDGENYNVGFVTTTDIPYREMVDAAKIFNGQIYTRRYGDNEE